MKIRIITPAPRGSRKGNRITALRWAALLRSLDHRVQVSEQYAGEECDVLVALHAVRSQESIRRFSRQHPRLPLIVALTGTDLYGQIQGNPSALEALELADRLIVLQRLGSAEVPEHLRDRVRVIHQSVVAIAEREPPRADVFEVCVLGHLRPVKDPLRTAQAARLLPAASRIQVVHIGAALSEDMAVAARVEEKINPRYRWLGEMPRKQALRMLARCRLLSLTSVSEGGANVISEAVVHSVPVVSSQMAGSVGLLGEDYPGYFPVGDTEALAALLRRVETDEDYYRLLQARCAALKPRFEPAAERESWRRMLDELSASG